MRPIADDGFTPGDEVDELQWLSPEDAADQLSYERDLVLLERLP